MSDNIYDIIRKYNESFENEAKYERKLEEYNTRRQSRITESDSGPTSIWMAAKLRVEEAINKHVEEHGEYLTCGYSDVVIENDGSEFSKFILRHEFGYIMGEHNRISIPYSKIVRPGYKYEHTQSLDIKEQGTRAFVKYLEEKGIKSYYESRMD